MKIRVGMKAKLRDSDHYGFNTWHEELLNENGTDAIYTVVFGNGYFGRGYYLVYGGTQYSGRVAIDTTAPRSGLASGLTGNGMGFNFFSNIENLPGAIV